MMTLLYIALWLLSGFLAAWVAHNLEQTHIGPRDTSIFQVVCFSLAGLFTVLLLVGYCVFELNLLGKSLSKPFFKAKEPK